MPENTSHTSIFNAKFFELLLTYIELPKICVYLLTRKSQIFFTWKIDAASQIALLLPANKESPWNPQNSQRHSLPHKTLHTSKPRPS